MNIDDCCEQKSLIVRVGQEATCRPRPAKPSVRPMVEAPQRESVNAGNGVISIQQIDQMPVAKVSLKSTLHVQPLSKQESWQNGEWLKPDPISRNPYETHEKPQPFFVSLYA